MILIAYASKYGATQEVAERIAKGLQKAGAPVEVKPVAQIGYVGKAKAVIVGIALYQGGWIPEATAFVRKNATALSNIPTWLFSVGPLSTDVKDEEQPVELAEFRDKLGLKHHVVFHGKLDHSKLDRSDRMTMKSAGAPEGDFRDWEAIDAWADQIGKSIAKARSSAA